MIGAIVVLVGLALVALWIKGNPAPEVDPVRLWDQPAVSLPPQIEEAPAPANGQGVVSLAEMMQAMEVASRRIARPRRKVRRRLYE